MDSAQFEQLNSKLDIMIKLLAASVVSGKNLTGQVRYLTAVGMTPSQIASTLGKSVNSITGITFKLRKQGALE